MKIGLGVYQDSLASPILTNLEWINTTKKVFSSFWGRFFNNYYQKNYKIQTL